MITPEEKKVFKTFALYLKTVGIKGNNSYRYFVLNHPDWDENYPDLIGTEDMDVYGSIDWHKITGSLYTALDSWLQRETAPKWDSSFEQLDESVSDSDSSNYNFEITLNFDNGEIIAEALGEYYLSDDQQISVYSVRDNSDFRTIVDKYKKSYPSIASSEFEFYGGGDDGYLPDEMNSNLGRLSISDELGRFVLRLLPSGWENDEGGKGEININFKDGTFEMSFTNFYREVMRNTIAEDNFLTNE
jgi:uncharacterized protein YegP (UPF0339 family)